MCTSLYLYINGVIQCCTLLKCISASSSMESRLESGGCHLQRFYLVANNWPEVVSSARKLPGVAWRRHSRWWFSRYTIEKHHKTPATIRVVKVGGFRDALWCADVLRYGLGGPILNLKGVRHTREKCDILSDSVLSIWPLRRYVFIKIYFSLFLFSLWKEIQYDESLKSGTSVQRVAYSKTF